MALTIYGSPASRTMRTLWMAAELGISYELARLEWADPTLKDETFLGLNPAGRIPTIVDDGFALSESLAINLYLAKKYGAPPLYPDTLQGEAETWRWSLWAQGELEPWVAPDARLAPLKGAAGPEVAELIERALETLDRALADKTWLQGEAFSVCDLNVAVSLSPSRASLLDLERWPHARAWLARCQARPAFIATRNRYAA